MNRVFDAAIIGEELWKEFFPTVSEKVDLHGQSKSKFAKSIKPHFIESRSLIDIFVYYRLFKYRVYDLKKLSPSIYAKIGNEVLSLIQLLVKRHLSDDERENG